MNVDSQNCQVCGEAEIYCAYKCAGRKPVSAHTPTPWKLDGVIVGDSGRAVATTNVHSDSVKWRESRAENEANAAFIVKAVNAHEEFINCFRLISEAMNTAVDNLPYWTREQLRSHLFQAQTLAEEAIAKAEDR